MKRYVTLALLLAMLFLGSCATAGRNFAIDQANRVTNGMSREEVIKIMGSNPIRVADQGRSFTWSYVEVGMLGGVEHRAVTFKFDENGMSYGVPAGGVFGDTTKYLK